MFRSGYIVSRRADTVWFLGLPFLAVLVALGAHHWLSVVAQSSVTLWITIPHHFATWLRTYGLSDDWHRWKARLTVGPIAIFALTLIGLTWAPITILALVMLWDHQHSIMQQHGLARIYDFKARTCTSSTRQFDLLLNWFLYVNMLLTAPLFTGLWLRELYHWGFSPTAQSVVTFQNACWGATAGFLVVYAGHVVWCISRGYAINPVKFVFIGASYFLWYYASWHTDSLLVFAIAHRLMHGIQYIVIVHSYVQHKNAKASDEVSLAARLTKPGNLGYFLLTCLLYAFIYQLIVTKPMDEFGFGLISFKKSYSAIPDMGLRAVTESEAYHLFAFTLVQVAAVVHYYVDSFIWKVSDDQTSQGL